jgi:hypothetical protein
MPINPCYLLRFIRAERMKAVSKSEHGEVMRRDREEREHLEKCVKCATSIEPLYLQLWPGVMLGVDVYAEHGSGL